MCHFHMATLSNRKKKAIALITGASCGSDAASVARAVVDPIWWEYLERLFVCFKNRGWIGLLVDGF